MDRIDFLLNSGRWIFDAEPRYTVALVAATRDTRQSRYTIEVAGRGRSRAWRNSGVHRATAPGPEVGVSASAQTGGCHSCGTGGGRRSSREARDSRGPIPARHGPMALFPGRELDETNDQASVGGRGAEGLPLWKGESFDQYDPHGAEARVCPRTGRGHGAKEGRQARGGSGSLVARESVHETSVSAARRPRDRARARRGISCDVYEPHEAPAPSSPAFVPPGDPSRRTRRRISCSSRTTISIARCLGLMNSSRSTGRRGVSSRHTSTTSSSSGFASPSSDDDTYDGDRHAAARLSCPDERFADFAAATGVEVGPLAPTSATRCAPRSTRASRMRGGSTPRTCRDDLRRLHLDAVPSAYRQRVRDRFAELA